MSNDAQWREDVHRWYYGGTPPAAYREDDDDAAAERLPADEAMGDEAAHPSLQAPHWPDAVLVRPEPPR